VERLERTARELLLSMSPEELDFRPAPGRWSAGENVLHMREVNERYLDAMEAKIAAARAEAVFSDGPFRYPWLDRWFVRQLEPPVTRRFPAPRIFRPAVRSAAREDVETFLATLERLAAAMRSSRGLDLARVKVPSPAIRWVRFRLGTCHRLLAAHTDRHLQQARDVTKNSDFLREGSRDSAV
jgi:hypothetical protein